MKRIPGQTLLPFGRSERVVNRQIRERAAGKKVRAGLGRPKKDGSVSHQARAAIGVNTSVLVTLKATALVPTLRSRRRYAVIKQAFVKYCASVDGFRLVHFAVLSNHVHFVCEADSRRALSMGLQKLLHSISRRLNALNVKERGGRVSTLGGSYRDLSGWIGSIFTERYHEHVLKTPTEMANAVRYVTTNAVKHYGTTGASATAVNDAFTSCDATLRAEPHPLVARACGFLMRRALARR